jgi:hypothetical protein
VYISAAEIQHSDGNRVSERQKRNQDTQRNVRTRAQRVYEQKFMDKGYGVSTAGLDEKQIREYIQNQERLEAGEQGYLNFQPPLRGFLRAVLIKSTLIGDLLILLRKHRIKAALAALAHSRLN